MLLWFMRNFPGIVTGSWKLDYCYHHLHRTPYWILSPRFYFVRKWSSSWSIISMKVILEKINLINILVCIFIVNFFYSSFSVLKANAKFNFLSPFIHTSLVETEVWREKECVDCTKMFSRIKMHWLKRVRSCCHY